MKRLFIILTILSISSVIFANADFDETRNFQFENAKAYEGEILYLLPITRSRYDGNRIRNELYLWFKDYSFNDNETSLISGGSPSEYWTDEKQNLFNEKLRSNINILLDDVCTSCNE